MDKQEAKLVLQSYRADGPDATDPAFVEALAMAERDPELKAWLEQELSLDRCISQKLCTCRVPADLKQAILTGHRSQAKVLAPEFVWWKSPALAWVAAITILFAAAFLLESKQAGRNQLALAEFRSSMTRHLNTGFGDFNVVDSHPAEIKSWLETRGLLENLPLPNDLLNTASIGCKLFDYQGAQPALICFRLPSQEIVHLFIVDKSSLGPVAMPDQIKSAVCNDWETCMWEKDGRLFLLAGKLSHERLMQLASN